MGPNSSQHKALAVIYAAPARKAARAASVSGEGKMVMMTSLLVGDGAGQGRQLLTAAGALSFSIWTAVILYSGVLV